MNYVFGKKQSLQLKGIAIVLMLFHHNFYGQSQYAGHAVSFKPFTESQIIMASDFSKICVAFFVFITGYGLALSLQKYGTNMTRHDYTKWTGARLTKVLSGYWFVVIISMILFQCIDGRTARVYFLKDGVFSGIYRMLADFFGFSKLLHIKNMNATWWYMGAALCFVVLMPFVVKAFSKYGYFLVMTAVFLLPKMLGVKLTSSTQPFPYIMALLFGVIFAQQGLFEKIKEWSKTKKILKFTIQTVFMVILFLAYEKIPIKIAWELKWGVIPVCIICYLVQYILPLKGLDAVLVFLGKHSMNIFFVHTFIRFCYLNDFTYSFKHFALITFVLLVVSLLCSILIETLKKIFHYQLLIDKIIRVIEK